MLDLMFDSMFFHRSTPHAGGWVAEVVLLLAVVVEADVADAGEEAAR